MFDLNGESYNIKDELQIRKILETHTKYNYIFDKNTDKYGYDIKSYRYTISDNGDYYKDFLGFIEIERSLRWKTFDIPSNWHHISFLKRKIFQADKENRCFLTTPKFNEKTFYLKFNRDLTNCFIQSMNYIIKHGQESPRNGKNKKLSWYYDNYLELDLDEVIYGIVNCLKFIEEHFELTNKVLVTTSSTVEDEDDIPF